MDLIFQELWAMVKQSGVVTAFLLFVCYMLNEERKEALKEAKAQRDKYDTMVERVLVAIHDSTASIKSLADLFKAGQRK